MVFEDVGLFIIEKEDKETKGTILDDNAGLIKGKPKRRLRRIITRPANILLRPLKSELKRRARASAKRRIKSLFKEPRFQKISVKEALAKDKPMF